MYKPAPTVLSLRRCKQSWKKGTEEVKMLKEASLSEMNTLQIPKEKRVMVNRGRGNDCLAPSDTLYREMSAIKTRLESTLGKGSAEAHNRAFSECRYESRFRQQIDASPEALRKLEKIASQARGEDLYLICYEGATKACHRRILMRIVAERFGVEVEIVGVEPT